MKTQVYFLLLFCQMALFARGQDIFVYDQQSVTDTSPGGFPINIQSSQPIAQSFTPTLPSIGFVRLFLEGPYPSDGSAASVYVDLWGGSVGGTLLGSTSPVSIPISFDSSANFFFSTPVAVTPGTQYYFQPVLEPLSSPATVGAYNYGYGGGQLYLNGAPQSGEDLWFREGIYMVPEPSSLWLLLLGSGIRFYVWRNHKKHRPAWAGSDIALRYLRSAKSSELSPTVGAGGATGRPCPF